MLKVWLPLNGDLHNQGCSNVTVTNNGATLDNNGKIGKCYSFNGSNNYLLCSPAQLSNDSNEWSFCCWFKPNNSHHGTLFCNRTTVNTTGITVIYYNTSFIIDDGGRWQPSSSAVQINQWNHIAVTVKRNEKICLYLNGVLINSTTSTHTPTIANATHFTIGGSQGSSTSATDNWFNGYINDVRIYDHALSAAEVKEISQGLVLHYKLDDLTNGVEDSSGYNHNAISNGSQPVTIDSDTPKYSYSTKFISGSRIAMPVASSTCLPKDMISMNIWIKTSNAANRFISCTESGGWNLESQNGYIRFPLYISGKGYTHCVSSTTTWNALSDNNWHMITITYDRIQSKIYIDGQLDTVANSSYPNIDIGYRSNTPLTLGAEAQTIASPIAGTYVGNLSDLRIYCTALDADAIRQLYEVGAKVDNKDNLHTFELSESNNGRELLAVPLTTSYGNRTNIYTNYDANGEITLTGSSSIGSNYIKINPTGNTYYYDFEVSIDAGNQVYIGFERFDAAKTSRSNSACMYAIAPKPSTALSHMHYHGTINIGTPFDANTPVDTIAVRILNDWSGAAGRSMTVHKMSLREVSTLQNTKINKYGQAITTELIEMNDKFRVQKNGIIETNEIIEL